MSFPSKPRPFPKDRPELYEAEIKKAGSVGKYAVEYGVTENTMRKWCKDAGAETKAGVTSGHYNRTEAVAIIERMKDEELSVVVGILGTDRACVVLNTTKNTLRSHLQQRGVIPRAGDHSPKASMLSQRVRRLEKDDAAIRELAKAIEDSAKQAPAHAPIKRPSLPVGTKHRNRAPVDVILHISDIQHGEVVHGDDVPGGGYSPDIFREVRLPRYVNSVIAILRGVALVNPLGTVWICLGGDMVEGEGIFAGQHWHLAMDAGQQVDTLSLLLAEALAEIATEAKSLGAARVAIVSVVGNHGVHGGKKAGAVPASLSYDWLCYRLTAARLSGMPNNGGIDFTDAEPRRAVYFEAANNIVLMTHGDQDKGGGLIGVPVVTGMRNDMTVRLQTGLDHRYHICGHFHRKTSITVGGTRMKLWNQDWCGANSLSVGRGGGGHPSQMVYVMHPQHGLHSSYIVNLADLEHDISHEIVR